MQSSSEQPLVGEERYVTTRITAAKETTPSASKRHKSRCKLHLVTKEKKNSSKKLISFKILLKC